MGPSHPPAADCPDAEGFEDAAVLDQPPTIPQAHAPFPEGVCCRAQMLERAAGPPEIPVGLEPRDRPLSRLDRISRPADEDIELSQARGCKGLDFVHTGS